MSRRAELDELVWRSDPHTALKHLVYRHYVGCWMGKILQRFPKATIVDAFAGPGRYSDGPAGSPVILAKEYLEHSHRDRFGKMRLLTSEVRGDRCDELDRCLAPLRSDVRLYIDRPRQGRFLVLLPELDRLAHLGTPGTPVLWVVDPFAKEPPPMDALRRCLAGPRDELLFTFFVDEIYRFGKTPQYERLLDQHYGDDSWRVAGAVHGEAEAKQAYVDRFCAALERSAGVMARSFGVAVKNQTPRYHVVYATKSKFGLECWVSATWSLDTYGGRQTHKGQGHGQLDLLQEIGPDLSRLREAMRANAGRALTWPELERQALSLGFRATQLRSVLDEMAGTGLAIRLQPLDA